MSTSPVLGGSPAVTPGILFTIRCTTRSGMRSRGAGTRPLRVHFTLTTAGPTRPARSWCHAQILKRIAACVMGVQDLDCSLLSTPLERRSDHLAAHASGRFRAWQSSDTPARFYRERSASLENGQSPRTAPETTPPSAKQAGASRQRSTTRAPPSAVEPGGQADAQTDAPSFPREGLQDSARQHPGRRRRCPASLLLGAPCLSGAPESHPANAAGRHVPP